MARSSPLEGHRSLLSRSVVAPAAGGHALRSGLGTFVRAELTLGDERLEVDLAVDSAPELAPPVLLDGVKLVSLEDLRASKLTCLLSRSEPRDLVDVLFLERAGYRPEADLPLALAKDAGVDPSVMGWLLAQFPVAPLPQMLVPLSAEELRAFRDELRARFRQVAAP